MNERERERVCVCVCAHACVCVCVCVRAGSLSVQATVLMEEECLQGWLSPSIVWILGLELSLWPGSKPPSHQAISPARVLPFLDLHLSGIKSCSTDHLGLAFNITPAELTARWRVCVSLGLSFLITPSSFALCQYTAGSSFICARSLASHIWLL